MAAGFLTTRILMVLLLSELDVSSAFPRARSSVWPSARNKPEGYGYGNRRPLQYIQALRQRNPAQVDPRGFQFSLNIPFAHTQGQSKETSSATKGQRGHGSGYAPPSYRPSSVQLSSSFNSPSAPAGYPGKGSAKNPMEGNPAPEVTKPSFQFSLSVPIHPNAPPQEPGGRSGAGGYPKKPQTSGGFVQNRYMEPVKPNPGPLWSGSQWVHYGSAMQQPQQQQIQMPLYTPYSAGTQASFTPGHAFVYTPATQHVSWAQRPTEQRLKYPEPRSTAPPVPQYPQQPHYVYGAQTSSHNYEGDRRNHQTSPPEQTGDHYDHYDYSKPVSSPPVPPAQYERPSNHYTTGNLALMKPTDFSSSSPHQHSRGRWGEEDLDSRAHLAAYDHNYHQPPVTPDKLYTGGEKPHRKPDYSRLVLDVEDVTDGNYYGGYSSA